MKYIGYLVFVLLLHFQLLAQEQWVIESSYLASPDTVWAFVPENITEGELRPTVILLHGYGGNYKQWHGFVDLQQQANESGFIFVCPDGLRSSWYFDSRNHLNSKYESFFFSSFIPSVLQRLPVDRKALFIDGFSMGGHGAMYLFLKKPELFAAVGSMSGVLDLKCSGLRNSNLKGHLGKYDPQKWNAYTAIGRLRLSKEKLKPMLVSCGRQDHLLACNQSFAKLASTLGFNITYIEQPGQHKPAYCRDNFYMHLAFFEALLK